MPERTPIRDEKELAEQLRREADRSRPEFSEALHARICRAVRESPAPEPRAAGRAGRRRASLWIAGLVAAACLAAAAVALEAMRRPGPPSDRPGESPLAGGPSAPAPEPAPAEPAVGLRSVTALTDRVSTGLPALVDSALASRQWAYLDHDARLTVQVLLDQLPLEVGPSKPGEAANTP